MVWHATSAVPVPECAFTSCLLAVSFSRLHWTVNSSWGHSQVPVSPVPHCRVEGVGVQKTPHLLLDVPQVLPAKRHPGHITEEAVQALETEGEGKKVGEESEECHLVTFVVKINYFLISFDSLNIHPFHSLIHWINIQHPFLLTRNLGGHLFFCVFKRSQQLFLSEKKVTYRAGNKLLLLAWYFSLRPPTWLNTGEPVKAKHLCWVNISYL